MHAVHPGRPVLRRAARAGRRAGLVRTRGRGRLPDRPAQSHRGCHGGGDRVRAARRRVEDWHGAVASDAARGSGRCASGGVMPQEFPGIPFQGLDLVEPVMYLSWTGDAPVVHPVRCQNRATVFDLQRRAGRLAFRPRSAGTEKHTCGSSQVDSSGPRWPLALGGATRHDNTHVAQTLQVKAYDTVLTFDHPQPNEGGLGARPDAPAGDRGQPRGDVDPI